MKKTLSIFSIAIIGMLLALSFSLADSGSNTYYVSPIGFDGPPCDGSSSAPWQSIQYAVDNAAAGDTIYVGAGTYYEKITINKGLRLIGDPSAGVGTNENAPIIDGSNFFNSGEDAYAFEITGDVNNLTISGFNIKNFTLSPEDLDNGLNRAALFIYGITTNNFEFSHNHLQNIDGYGLVIRNYSGYNNSPIINYNRIEGVSENILYIGNLNNADISYNEFIADRTDTFTTAIHFTSSGTTTSATTSSNNQITNNTFTSTNNYATDRIINIETSSEGANAGIINGFTISNNNFLISGNALKTALKIDVASSNDEINNLSITNNTFNVTDGKSLNIQGSGNINSWTIRDNKFTGVNNTGVTSTLAINAEKNWWGDASGPYNATSNVSGLGSDVSNNIDYAPWYGADYTNGDHSSAWDWHTNGVNGSTIQETIDISSAGDTVYVGAGTYSERVVLDKNISLIGDPGDANTAGPGENAPTIDGSIFLNTEGDRFAFEIANTVSNLKITGFNIKNFKLSETDIDNGYYAGAVFIYDISTSNFEFSHNYLNNIDGLGVVVRHYSGYNNSPIITYNRAEGVSGNILYLNNLNNANISNNEFVIDRVDDFTTAIYFSTDGNGTSSFISTNNQIKNNTFTSTSDRGNTMIMIDVNSEGDNLGSFDGLTFSENTFILANNEGKNALEINLKNKTGVLNNTSITNNTFNVAGGKSILLNQAETESIDNLIIENNRFTGTGNFGITSSTMIKAEKNWWGDVSGPYNNDSNILGSGSKVSNKVDYAPWYGADYTNDDHSSVWDWGTNSINDSKIQETIDLAFSGDTIHVGPGTYYEKLVLNKAVSLIGDPGETNQTGPGANAPIINGANFAGSPDPLMAIEITTDVNDLKIKGFNITNFNPSIDAEYSVGIMAYEVNTNNFEVSHNKIDNICNLNSELNCYGVVLNDNGGNNRQAIISYNYFENLNDQMIYVNNLIDSKINNNIFKIINNPATAINFFTAATTSSNNEIANNIITSSHNTGLSAIFITTELTGSHIDGLNLTNNEINMSGNSRKYGIYISKNNPEDSFSNIIINNNKINSNGSKIFNLSGDTMDVSISNNSFTGTDSLGVESSFPISATNNWWGTTSGPYHDSNNPKGSGPKFSDTISVRPWCAESTCATNDNTAPTATLSYSKNAGATFNDTVRVHGGTLIIKAVFNEAIEDATGVQINIDNGILATTAMSKINDTTYQYSLTVPSANASPATVTLSRVADLSGNLLSSTTLRTFIVDTTNPIITLVGDNPQIIEFGNNYNELGATGNDNLDGDISNNIITNNSAVDIDTLGEYLVTYDLDDQSGNEANQVARTVKIVDTTKPTITLIGDATVSVNINDTYTERRATASDNYDGNLSEDVVISGEVNTAVAGTYIVKYNVEDSSGNDAVEKTRTVTVTNNSGGGGGGGGGGGSNNLPAPTYQVYNPNTGETTNDQNNPDNGQTGTLETNEPTEGQVLGVKITNTSNNSRETQLQQIINDAKEIFNGKLENILQNVNKERDLSSEKTTNDKYIKSLTSGSKNLSEKTINTLNNFITYGTESTNILGEGERAGVISSFKSTFGKLPSTEADWSDIVKIANGRWPNQRNEAMENKAEKTFQKIYLRKPDRNNPNDDAAVTVMAYGLRPSDRNLDSEKTAIKTFRYIFNTNPKSASDWDAVRAIAYSGSKR